jgi:hypothetical protein
MIIASAEPRDMSPQTLDARYDEAVKTELY